MHVHPPDRRRQNEGEEVSRKVVCCAHVFASVCVCVGGGVVSLERIVSFLSVLVFQGGDESNLQIASAIQEQLNPISTRQTQMDHRRISEVQEA